MGKYDHYCETGKDEHNEVIASLVGISEHLAVYLVADGSIKIASDRPGPPTHWETEVHRRYERILSTMGRLVPHNRTHRLLLDLASATFNALSVDGPGRKPAEFFADIEDQVRQRGDEYAHRWYLTGCLVAIVPLAFVAAVAYERNFSLSELPLLLVGVAGGTLGSVISVLRRSPRLQFGEVKHRYFHGLQGAIRVALGVLFGFMLVVGMKAGLIATIASDNAYAVLAFASVAGYSERMVPELMERWKAGATREEEARES